MKYRIWFVVSILIIICLSFSLSQAATTTSSQSETIATLTEKLNKAISRIDNFEKQIQDLKKPQDTIKAKRFVVINNRGIEVANFGIEKTDDSEFTSLRLFSPNKEKNEPASLCLSAYDYVGGTITLTDKKEEDSSTIYNFSFIPSKSEWNILRFVSDNNNEQYLTDNLVSYCINAHLDFETKDKFKSILYIYANTKPQPGFDDNYIGNGRFSLSDREVRAEYETAGNEIKQLAGNYLNLENYDSIVISFSIRGNDVGTWTDGEMKLKGE